MVHSLSLHLLFLSDRTFLILLVDSESTAIYSFAYTICLIPLAISTSIETIWIPFFNENYLNKNFYKIKSIFTFILIFVTLIFVCVLFLSPFIVKFLNSSYLDSIEYIPLLLFCNLIIFFYSFLVNQQILNGNFNYILIATSLSTLLNLLLNYILIPKYLINGALYSTLISYIFLFLLHYYFSYSKNKSFNLYYFLLASLIFFISYGLIN